MNVKLGIPSKGRMRQEVSAWFSQRGTEILTAGHDRSYSAYLVDFPEMQIIFLPATEIPNELACGRIHLGITGQDLVQEKVVNWDSWLVELATMDIAHAKLVFAVPKCWADVNDLSDVDEVANLFREKSGFRLRIATKYNNLVRQHLREFGLADYKLVSSQGATEGLIENQAAEMIADITSTGETFSANNLKILSTNPIIESEAALFASKNIIWSEELLKKLGNFCEKISIKGATEKLKYTNVKKVTF